jgi:hypothetical protein
MARVYYDEDAAYLRCLEDERIELVGPEIEYYSLNRGTHVDALYGEPTNDPLYGGASARGTDSKSEEAWNFYPGDGVDSVTMPAAVEYEQMTNREPVVRENGTTWEYDMILVISRDAWECALEDLVIDGRLPKEGDVLYVPDYGEWMDVTKVGTGGNVSDSGTYVGFRFELKKRTRFTPDRKVA